MQAISPQRTHALAPWLGCIAALVIGVCLLFTRLELTTIPKILGALLATGNLACVAAMIWRSRQRPEERLGWLAFAVSQGLTVFANLLMAQTMHTPEGEIHSVDWIWFLDQAVIAGLQCWALLHWPWENRSKRHPSHNIVGSLLFILSLLLLFWTTGISTPPPGIGSALPVIQGGTMLRSTIVAGIAIFLLVEEPRRGRGVLGLVLAYILISVFVCILLKVYMDHPNELPKWTLGMTFPGPLFLLLATLSGMPVDTPHEPETRPSRSLMIEALTYAPFLISGLLLTRALHLRQSQMLWPFLGFIVVAILQILREILILNELRRVNSDLESRVRERTRSLEDLQAVMLRTERMNTQAMLGAGMTHDLNNLLCAVTGQLQVLQIEAERGIAATEKQIQLIVDAAMKAAEMSQRVMSLGKESHPANPQDLRESIKPLTDLLQMLAGRRIKLQVSLPGEPLTSPMAKAQIEQIIVNLVGNARDAMPDGGHIHVALERTPEGYARLSVKDSGTGIPPEIMPKLFQAYFTTKAPGKGTGLGLASIKNIVEEAGGRISVESQLNQGTTFVVELPLA